MPLDLMDVANASYRTTRTADAQCTDLLKKLGYKTRYLPARLAIARSLSLSSVPPSLTLEDDEESAVSIRGQQLFGDGSDPAAWLALIVERSGKADLARKDLQSLVASHWRRGADLLTRDWEEANGDLGAFVARLADLANLREGAGPGAGRGDTTGSFVNAEVVLPVGEIGEDVQTGERLIFPLNAAGGSPHMAIMGGAGSGKTRTVVHMLRKLRDQGDVPLLAFDFKGDLADSLGAAYDAEVVSPPRVPVPLDCLHVASMDETGLREAAGRIRESIARVKTSKISGVQSDALRAAIYTVLSAGTRGHPVGLVEIAKALSTEYQQRGRKPDELAATLNELNQFKLFEPSLSPKEFFEKSWVIRLPQDGTQEVRRLIINLTLDALDRWLNSQTDAPMVDGRRGLRHVCLLDEAHVILSTKLPALGNLVRMSRSKGGVIALVSQSPDDFESDSEGYLDNMGLTMAFSTQARPGPIRAIFGGGVSLVDLPVGQALCRIRTDAKVRRVLAWQP
jgi:hypothetical protein